MTIGILIILVSLILSAFFSGMEIAYVSSNKVHIEIEKRRSGFIARILKSLTAKPSMFIASMIIGNNIVLVIYGFYMGDLLTEWLSNYFQHLAEGFSGILVKTIISTLVILLTAEFLPKVFFQIYANNLLKFFALPAYFFYLLFYGISRFVIGISDSALKLFSKHSEDEVRLSFSKVELGNYINEQLESTDEEEQIDSEIHIFQNALDFAQIKAREAMVPRTEIVAVDIETNPKELIKRFSETGLSKILVFEESIDDVTGYVHSFDLFKKPESIKAVVKPLIFVPETMLVKEVLNLLIKKHKSIAVVLDEYGGTAGLITVEDIVEELFGEIEDEHDSDNLVESKLADDEYKFSARLEVDYINEVYKLNIPEDDAYETLGGFIVNHTEEIPKEGDQLHINEFEIKILETSNNKIDLVKIRLKETDD